RTAGAWGGPAGGLGCLLTPACSQGRNDLAGGALDNAHQLCDCFVVSRQRSQLVDLVSCKVIAFTRGCLDLELVLALGEFLEQAGSGARMLVGKRDQSRTDKDVVQALVLGTFNSTTQQGVTYDTYVHASFASVFAQTSHGSYAYTAGISHNGRQRTFGSFVDFSDDGLFVFELDCHGFYSWIYH